MRVVVQALLELGHPRVEPPVRLYELAYTHEQGDGRLAVTIQNRLCLGAVHGG